MRPTERKQTTAQIGVKENHKGCEKDRERQEGGTHGETNLIMMAVVENAAMFRPNPRWFESAQPKKGEAEPIITRNKAFVDGQKWEKRSVFGWSFFK